MRYDAVIIGGGFYGASIATYLVRRRTFRSVILVEREAQLLARASYRNQARVHNGYHYPRSFRTAFRSRVNLPTFINDHPEAIAKSFTKLYAIARRNSKITTRQFVRFCREIGAKLEPASQPIRALFNPQLVEDVFLAEEYAFDSTALEKQATRELTELGIDVRKSTRVSALAALPNGIRIDCEATGHRDELEAAYVFNCTYSGINQIHGAFPGTSLKIKHELTEMALVRMPPVLQHLGVTLMDGPFFSAMPFPARGLHTLSHVRYTPHRQWADVKGTDPYEQLASYSKDTRVDRMRRDAGRYMPALLDAEYMESLFEVKTILIRNEGDDGRPILFERHAELPRCYSVLGGKIDNIYDILEKLDAEPLSL